MGGVTLLPQPNRSYSWLGEQCVGGSADASFQTSPWSNNPDAAKYALDAGAPYDSQYYGVNFKITFYSERQAIPKV